MAHCTGAAIMGKDNINVMAQQANGQWVQVAQFVIGNTGPAPTNGPDLQWQGSNYIVPARMGSGACGTLAMVWCNGYQITQPNTRLRWDLF